jgi:hypothetical protein
MRKLLCLIRGHRLRIVQEFGTSQRRLKCERCGGDWGMHDDVRLIIPWDQELQRMYREHGYEILEPAEFPVPVEPLTSGEFWRACRWPIAIAVTLSWFAAYALEAAGIESLTVRLIAMTAFAWALGRYLGRGAIDRAYERKRNTLLA